MISLLLFKSISLKTYKVINITESKSIHCSPNENFQFNSINSSAILYSNKKISGIYNNSIENKQITNKNLILLDKNSIFTLKENNYQTEIKIIVLNKTYSDIFVYTRSFTLFKDKNTKNLKKFLILIVEEGTIMLRAKDAKEFIYKRWIHNEDYFDFLSLEFSEMKYFTHFSLCFQSNDRTKDSSSYRINLQTKEISEIEIGRVVGFKSKLEYYKYENTNEIYINGNLGFLIVISNDSVYFKSWDGNIYEIYPNKTYHMNKTFGSIISKSSSCGIISYVCEKLIRGRCKYVLLSFENEIYSSKEMINDTCIYSPGSILNITNHGFEYEIYSDSNITKVVNSSVLFIPKKNFNYSYNLLGKKTNIEEFKFMNSYLLNTSDVHEHMHFVSDNIDFLMKNHDNENSFINNKNLILVTALLIFLDVLFLFCFSLIYYLRKTILDFLLLIRKTANSINKR